MRVETIERLIANIVNLPPNWSFEAIDPQPASLAIDAEYSVR